MRVSVLTFWVCILLAGCNGNPALSVKGIVVNNVETSESLLLGARRYVGDNDTPLSGANVRVYLDSKLTEEAKKCATVSDAFGKYEIATNNFPPPKDPDGYYYLLVEKDGFRPLTYPIYLGGRSRYMEHTVYLGASK